jgi:hypothetical protein
MFKIHKVALVFGLLALQGCASVATMENKEIDQSAFPSKTYQNNKADVVSATKKAIDVLGYNLKNVEDGAPVTVIYFSKPMSAFSWGEVGRIDVKDLDGKQTLVMLASEKRLQFQVTGAKQDDFARRIFSSLDMQLQ